MLTTPRLRLHYWNSGHRDAFAAMHRDEGVMADLGGPITMQASNEKFDRYVAALENHGISRWAVENLDGQFLGYSGVMPRLDASQPLGPHFEIGWRFNRMAWGNGYATESAKAALTHAVNSVDLTKIVSYTNPENTRSQSVMRKLDLRRDVESDFALNRPDGRSLAIWVWRVRAGRYSL
jgi:RimJ/RimL family protein N-acetyltransferase